MPELKLRKTGNSLSTSWPKEALARMNAKEGDTLYAIETPQGFLVTPFDPKFAKAMEAADRVFHRYKNAKVLVTYHPSYLLRNPSAKKHVWDDMQMLLKEMCLPIPGKS